MAAHQLQLESVAQQDLVGPNLDERRGFPEIFEFGLTGGERARRVRVINPRRRRPYSPPSSTQKGSPLDRPSRPIHQEWLRGGHRRGVSVSASIGRSLPDAEVRVMWQEIEVYPILGALGLRYSTKQVEGKHTGTDQPEGIAWHVLLRDGPAGHVAPEARHPARRPSSRTSRSGSRDLLTRALPTAGLVLHFER